MSGVTSASNLAAASAATSIGGTATKAIGSIEAGNAQSAAAGYNAQIQQQNAQLNLNNADLTAAEGDINSAQAGMKTRAQIGGTLAQQGASGVDVNSGSSVNVRASEADVGMQNAMQIRGAAARQAYGYQEAAYGNNSQAALDIAAGKNAKIAGNTNAEAGILGGVSDVGDKLTKYMQAGGPLAGITSTDSETETIPGTPIDAYTGEDYSGDF